MKIKKSYVSNQFIHISQDSEKYNSYTWGKEVYELDAVNFFYKQIIENKASTIVDIGAQSGAFSLMAKFLPHTTWYSFEPDPLNYKLCMENIKINDIHNIILRREAISNTIGKSTFNICTTHKGLNTLGQNVKRFKIDETETISVDLNTLDNLFQNTKIDIIKIDTEGAEYNILSGAKNIIQKYNPKILLEYNKINLLQFNKTLNDLNILIKDLKYTITWQNEDNIFIEPDMRQFES